MVYDVLQTWHAASADVLPETLASGRLGANIPAVFLTEDPNVKKSVKYGVFAMTLVGLCVMSSWAGGQVTDMPEPSSWLLLTSAGGALGFAGYWLRKRRK